MSEVKIVLKRTPSDPDNGVWIDGIKVPLVKEVAVYGGGGQIPQVVLTLIPDKITLGLDDPDIDKVSNDQKN